MTAHATATSDGVRLDASLNARLTELAANPVDLEWDELVELSRDVLTGYRIPFKRQGGYAAKFHPDLLAKDHMPALYPPETKLPPTGAQQDRMDRGNEFEDYVGDAVADVPGVIVINEVRDADGERTEAGKAAKEHDTFAAYLDPEVRFIFNARIGGYFAELVSEHLGLSLDDEHRVSEPDAIELGPTMANGLRAMRFIDVKWHKATTGKSAPKEWKASPLDAPFLGDAGTLELVGNLQKDDWLQLAHYYRHGQQLHLVDGDESLWAAVIGKEEQLVWARLDTPLFQVLDPAEGKRRKQSPLEIYDRQFARAVDVVTNALARNADPRVPALTAPEWTTEIKESGWTDVCLAELQAHGNGGHITLLPGITPDKSVGWIDAGITDVVSLAACDPDAPVTKVSNPAKDVYQARVQLAGVPARQPGVNAVDVPITGIEVDFDYEADELVYQRGVRVTYRDPLGGNDDVQMHMLDDFTGTEDGERDIFVAQWRLFGKLTAEAAERGTDIRFYHYTGYELYRDRELAEKYAGAAGVPFVEEVEEFYASHLCVDLFKVLSTELVWPTMSHSIKDLAPYVGFAWPEAGQNGAESMVWYRTALASTDPAVVTEFIERLRGYNTADCHAQYVLREWVRSHDNGTGPGSSLVSIHDLAAA